jgi:hypothetical protein
MAWDYYAFVSIWIDDAGAHLMAFVNLVNFPHSHAFWNTFSDNLKLKRHTFKKKTQCKRKGTNMGIPYIHHVSLNILNTQDLTINI